MISKTGPHSFWQMGLFSWPLIVAALFEPLSATVDTAFVGHKSTEWLAALAAAVALLSAFTWMFNFLVHASTQSISFALGAKHDVAEQVQLSLVWALGVGLFSAALLFSFRTSLYQLVGVESSLWPLVDTYFVVRVFAHPLVLLNTTTLSLLRGLQKVSLSFWLVLVSCSLNIFLSWLFLWPLELGLGGVAWASAISYLLTWLLGTYFLAQFCPTALKSWRIKNFSSSFRFGQKSLHLFGRSFILSGCFFVCTKVAAHMGVIELATYQVALQFWLFSSFVVDGVAMAATILCAQHVGAKDLQQAREVARSSLQWGVVWGVIFTSVYLLAGPKLWQLFTNDVLVIEQLRMIWPIIAIGQIFLCFSYVFDGILFGLDDFSFLRKLIFYGAVFAFAPFLLYAYVQQEPRALWLALLSLGMFRLLGGWWRTRRLLPPEGQLLP